MDTISPIAKRQFGVAYFDDITLFPKRLEKSMIHTKMVPAVLEEADVTLTLNKYAWYTN